MVRRALFVEQMEQDNNDDEAVPDDGDPNYIVVDDDESIPKPIPKTPKPTMERVLALQARFNTPDAQVALWWNMVSLDQGITNYRRLTCADTVTNMRESQGDKIISSHVQEFSGIFDMAFDGKKSQTAIGKNYALKTYD